MSVINKLFKILIIILIWNNNTLANNKICPVDMIFWQGPNDYQNDCTCGGGRRINTDLSQGLSRFGKCQDSYGLDGNNTPLSINNLSLWLDADDPYANGVRPNIGDKISIWVDKSGNNNHAIQTNNTFQPTYVENSLGNSDNFDNGKGSIFFNSNQYLISNNDNIKNTLYCNDLTIFIVVRILDSNFYGYYYPIFDKGPFYSSKPNEKLALIFNNQSNVYCYTIPYGGESTQYICNDPYFNNIANLLIITAVSSMLDNKSSIYGNNTIQSQTTTYPGCLADSKIFNNLYIGTYIDQSAFLSGYIAELIIYTTKLSDEQIALINNYLNHKWLIHQAN